MIDSVVILDKIIFDPPLEKIYSRLGYRKSTTSLSASHHQETKRHIQEAASLISLKASFLRLPILDNDNRTVHLSAGLTFASSKLSLFLRKSLEAVLMGATAGGVILEAIKDKTRQGDMTAAVVFDATASEMTDATLDWLTDYINRQLRREGRRMLARRFSAGYADFALENQKDIYQALQMEKIGVTLTPGFILQPEKSVTAIGGIV